MSRRKRVDIDFAPLDDTAAPITSAAAALPRVLELIDKAATAQYCDDAHGLRAALAEMIAWRNGVRDGSQYAEWEKQVRKDAAAHSRAVTRGKSAEQFVPFLSTFPYAPSDVRFIGTPIDYVVFDGLSLGTVERVVLVEVKSGTARLSKREHSVREAVEAGRVEWRVEQLSDATEPDWLNSDFDEFKP